MKTVKKMVLFFDYLYESIDIIGPAVIAEWSHKETPREVYVLIDIDDINEKELDIQGVSIYSNKVDAIKEMNEWNEC